MLTAEIKVNGCLIAHLYIHNEGEIEARTNPRYRYNYEYVEIGHANNRKIGFVSHYRKDGALKLIHSCIEDMER